MYLTKTTLIIDLTKHYTHLPLIFNYCQKYSLSYFQFDKPPPPVSNENKIPCPYPLIYPIRGIRRRREFFLQHECPDSRLTFFETCTSFFIFLKHCGHWSIVLNQLPAIDNPSTSGWYNCGKQVRWYRRKQLWTFCSYSSFSCRSYFCFFFLFFTSH